MKTSDRERERSIRRSPSPGSRIPSPARLVGRVRQKSDRSRPLDRRLELALVKRAGPGDAPREDLAPLGNEGLEQLDVFPVHVLELLRAELADLPAPDEEFLAGRR